MHGMRTRSLTILFAFVAVLLFSSTSCELINPDEQIPAFLCIDTIAINPGTNQGTEMHDIVDAWVYANQELIGVYELPAVVPILATGPTDIRIEPGIKLNGQSATRWSNEFFLDYEQSIELFPDSVICINPTLPFQNSVEIPWVEDFEIASQVSLTTTSLSEENVQIVSGEEAFQGNSAKLSLSPDKNAFECRSAGTFSLPAAGADVILEFTYKCNHQFVVSLNSFTSTGTVSTGLVSLFPTDEWRHVYISLTPAASAQFTASGHQPVIGFLRSVDGSELNVYIDNIRLTHF